MEEGPQKEDLSMRSSLIAALGLAILTVIFALQNAINGFGADVNICLGSVSEFVGIDSCYSKKKIGNFKSEEEDRGAGE
jgi:hypothetical protein